MSQRKITTLELQMTGRSAKQFLDMLAQQAEKAQTRVGELMKRLAETKRSAAYAAKDAEALKLATQLERDLAVAREELALFSSAAKSNVKNINAYAEAMDNLSGMSLAQLKKALKEADAMMLNFGKNVEKDQEVALKMNRLVTEIKARAGSLSKGIIEPLDQAKKALREFGKGIDGMDNLQRVMEGQNDTFKKIDKSMKDWEKTIALTDKGYIKFGADYTKISNGFRTQLSFMDKSTQQYKDLQTVFKELGSVNLANVFVAGANGKGIDFVTPMRKSIQDALTVMEQETKNVRIKAFQSALSNIDNGSLSLEYMFGGKGGGLMGKMQKEYDNMQKRMQALTDAGQGNSTQFQQIQAAAQGLADTMAHLQTGYISQNAQLNKNGQEYARLATSYAKIEQELRNMEVQNKRYYTDKNTGEQKEYEEYRKRADALSNIGKAMEQLKTEFQTFDFFPKLRKAMREQSEVIRSNNERWATWKSLLEDIKSGKFPTERLGELTHALVSQSHLLKRGTDEWKEYTEVMQQVAARALTPEGLRTLVAALRDQLPALEENSVKYREVISLIADLEARSKQLEMTYTGNIQTMARLSVPALLSIRKELQGIIADTNVTASVRHDAQQSLERNTTALLGKAREMFANPVGFHPALIDQMIQSLRGISAEYLREASARKEVNALIQQGIDLQKKFANEDNFDRLNQSLRGMAPQYTTAYKELEEGQQRHNAAIEQANGHLEKMQGMLEGNGQREQALAEQRVNAEQKVQAAQQGLTQLEALEIQNKSGIAAIDSQIIDKEQHITELVKERDAANGKNLQQQAAISNMEAQVGEQNTKVLGIKQQIEEANQKNAQIAAQNAEAEAAIANAQVQEAERAAQIATIEAEIEQRNQNILNLKNQIAAAGTGKARTGNELIDTYKYNPLTQAERTRKGELSQQLDTAKTQLKEYETTLKAVQQSAGQPIEMKLPKNWNEIESQLMEMKNKIGSIWNVDGSTSQAVERAIKHLIDGYKRAFDSAEYYTNEKFAAAVEASIKKDVASLKSSITAIMKGVEVNDYDGRSYLKDVNKGEKAIGKFATKANEMAMRDAADRAGVLYSEMDTRTVQQLAAEVKNYGHEMETMVGKTKSEVQTLEQEFGVLTEKEQKATQVLEQFKKDTAAGLNQAGKAVATPIIPESDQGIKWEEHQKRMADSMVAAGKVFEQANKMIEQSATNATAGISKEQQAILELGWKLRDAGQIYTQQYMSQKKIGDAQDQHKIFKKFADGMKAELKTAVEGASPAFKQQAEEVMRAFEETIKINSPKMAHQMKSGIMAGFSQEEMTTHMKGVMANAMKSIVESADLDRLPSFTSIYEKYGVEMRKIAECTEALQAIRGKERIYFQQEQADTTALTEKLNEESTAVENLRTKLEGLKNQPASTVQKQELIDTKALESELEKEEGVLKQLNEQLANLKNQPTQDVAAMTENIQKQEEALGKLRIAMTALTDRKADLESQRAALEGDAEALKKFDESAEGKELQALPDKMDRIRQSMDNARNSIESNKAAIERNGQQMEKMKSDYDNVIATANMTDKELKQQEQIWREQCELLKNAKDKTDEYTTAQKNLAAVQTQQKTNAMSNLGLTANGTSFDVGTTGMLAQLNDQSFPKTIEWLNKLKQEVEAFKTKFVTTPEGAQMLNQQLEIANTQLQALGATAANTGQQNLFTLQETGQKMRDILANMAARKHPFVGDSGAIEKMNASLKKFRENLVKNGQSTNEVDRAIRGMKGALDTSKVSMDDFKKILAKPSKCDDIEKLNHVLEVVRARAKAAGGATAEQMLQMRALDKQAKELNQTFGYHASTLENAASRLKSYIMIYMGFNAMMMKARQAISGNLELADSISNVQKVSGLTEEQVNKLSDALQRLDSRAKTSELMQIAYQGSKMGVAAQGGATALQEFTESANKLNSALGEDFGGAEAVGKLTKLTQTMGIAARDCSNLNIALEKTGSAILTLGNNTTANYAYINNFATRLGGISRAANISMPDLLAIGATMDVMGMQAEMSATAITKFISTLSKKPEQLASAIKMSTEDLKEFNAAISRGDTMTAFMKVFETLNKNKANLQDIANVLKDMVGGGNNTRALQVLTAMANGYQTLAANVAMSNRAFEDGTAIQNEYNIMNENAAAYAKRAGNAIAEIFINAGNVGVFKDMMKGLADTFEYLQAHTIAFVGTLMNIGLVMKLTSKESVKVFKAEYARIREEMAKTSLGFRGLWAGVKAGAITTFAGVKAAAMTAFGAIKSAAGSVAIFAVFEVLVWGIQKLKDLYDESQKIDRAMREAKQEALLEQGKITVLSNTIDRLTKQKKAYEQQVDKLAEKEAASNKQKEKEQKVNEALAVSTKKTKEEQEKALKAAQDAYEMHAKNSIEKARETNRTTELEDAQKKLKKTTTELGEAERTMVSILLKHFDAEDLVAKGIINTTNALIDKKKAQEELNKVIQDSYLQNATNELYGENLKVYVKSNIDAAEDVRKRVNNLWSSLNDKQKVIAGDPESVVQNIMSEYTKAAYNQINGGRGLIKFSPETWKFFNTVASVNGFTGDEVRKSAVKPLVSNYDFFNEQKRTIQDVTGKMWTMSAKEVGQPDVNEGADLDGNKSGNSNRVDKAPEVAKRVKDAANDADKAVAVMLDDLKTILLRMFSDTQDMELKSTLQKEIDDIDKRKDLLRSKLNDYYMKVTDVNPLEGFMSEEYLQRYAEEVERTNDEEMRRSLESIRRWREGWDRKDGTRMQSAKDNANDARRGLSEGYMMHVPEEFYKWTKANKKGEQSSTPYIDDKELARLLSEILEERGIKADEYMLKAAEKGAEHVKKIMAAIMEGNPLMKVQDDFVKTLDQLDIFYAKSQDWSADATKRRIDILSAYTAQITTMTEEEFVERIRLQREYADLTETEAKVLYDKLLQYRDDYDEASRKKAKRDLKLMQNRIDSGEYYANQLATLRKYQSALEEMGKTGTEAYQQIARAIDVVSKKQNQMVNGKRTTYQQRLKQNVESATTRVKMEEGVGKSGVNNSVQLSLAKTRAAFAEFTQTMEDYQLKQDMANGYRQEAVKAFEAAREELESTEEGTKAHTDALVKLQVKYRDLQSAEVMATEVMGDSYDKLLEKQRAMVEQEQEVLAHRVSNVKEFAEAFSESISKYAMADIEAYDSSIVEMTKLRAERELGIEKELGRQRYLIIKHTGDYTTEYYTKEEAARKKMEIDAENQRLEARAEGLKAFAEKVSQTLRDAWQHSMQLSEEEKRERQRQEMIQKVQNDSLVIQQTREGVFTKTIASEWEARLDSAKRYFDYVNGEQYGFVSASEPSATRSLSGTEGSKAAGSPVSNNTTNNTTNTTTNNTSTTTTNNSTTTNVYNNVYNDNVEDQGMGDGTVTIYLPKDLQEAMTKLANGQDAGQDAMKRLCEELGTNEAGIQALIPHIKDYSAMMSNPNLKATNMRELEVVAQDLSKGRILPGQATAPQDKAVAMIDEKAWKDMFKSVLGGLNVDSVVFDAISNAKGGIGDKDAWKAIGQAVGWQLAASVTGVLNQKLSEWVATIGQKKYTPVSAIGNTAGVGASKKDIKFLNRGENLYLGQRQDAANKKVDAAKKERKQLTKAYGSNSSEAVKAGDAVLKAQMEADFTKEFSKLYKEQRKALQEQTKAAKKAMIEANNAIDKAKDKDTARADYNTKRAEYERLAKQGVDTTKVTDDTMTSLTKEGGKYNDLKYSTGDKVLDIEKYNKAKETKPETPAAKAEERIDMKSLINIPKTEVNADIQPMVSQQEKTNELLTAVVNNTANGGEGVKEGEESLKTQEEIQKENADKAELDLRTSMIDSDQWNSDVENGIADLNAFDTAMGNVKEGTDFQAYSDLEAKTDMSPEEAAEAERLKAQMMLAVWQEYYDQLAKLAEDSGKDSGKAVDEEKKKKISSRQEETKEAVKEEQKKTKSEGKEQQKRIAGQKAADAAKAAMSEASAQGSMALGNTITQATGSEMLGQLTAGVAQVGADAVMGIASGSAKTIGQMGWWGAALIPVITSLLMGLLASATSKAKKAKSEISSATGTSVSAGKLTTGMLTYATGKYLVDEEDAKNFKARSGMLAFADGYTPGQSYNVDGADGKSYDARFVGKVSDMGTGIKKGTHFGIFSEVKPEMVIDGDTTALMHNKYPMLENAILQLHRTGSLNMPELLGLDYNSISHTIDTLSKNGALGGMPRMSGFRMPTFADGSYPYEGGESGSMPGMMTQAQGMDPAQMEQLTATLALLQETLAGGISASMSTHDASKQLARQKRWEQRNGIHNGING